MKNTILSLVCILFSLFSFAQDYQKLNEDIYELHLSEKPFDTIKILENNVPVKLIPGKYNVPRNEMVNLSQSLVTIDENGLVKDNFIIKHKDGIGYVKVKSGVMSQLDFMQNEILIFQFTITDSTTIERDYNETGELEREEIIYFMDKDKGKKIITRYGSESYSVSDQIKMISTEYYMNGALKKWVKLDEKDNERLEEKHYLQNGELNRHIYTQNGIKYTEEYEQKHLKEKTYTVDEVTFTEKYNNGKIIEKIEEREITGGKETSIYDGSGKLIEKTKSWYPASL